MRHSHSMEMAMSLPEPRCHPFERLNVNLKVHISKQLVVQAMANKANAAKSTGPKTRGGKAKVSGNA